mgnify:CR=1 FL=1
MKPVPIPMKQWLAANERTRVLPGDQWYLNFSASILSLVKQSPLFKEDDYAQKDATVSLTMYFQDVIAQTGGWKTFTELYYKQYNTYLPFYPLSDSYIPDEINPEDIAFVLWTLKSHFALYGPDEYTLQNPYDKDLLALAQEAYKMMDEKFEEAPINEKTSSFLWVMGPDLLDMPFVPLPEITPETKLSKDVEHCLEYSGGKPLLYFATYKELCKFFVEVLKWENTRSALLPDLQYKKEFVIYANAKGMLIAHDVAAYFCEEHNPMYNAKRAAAEGYKLFCRPGGSFERLARKKRKVRKILSRLIRRPEGLFRLRKMRLHGVEHIPAHFEFVPSDPGSEPDGEVAFALEFLAKLSDRLLDDAVGEAAPAGMHGRNDPPLAVRDQDREAVGRHHDGNDARRLRPRGIRLRGVGNVVGMKNFSAVHL